MPELAQQLDVPPARVYAWLSGRSGPSGDRLQRVADALGLQVGRDLPAHPTPAQAARGAVGGPSGLDCGPSDDRTARLLAWAMERNGPDA